MIACIYFPSTLWPHEEILILLTSSSPYGEGETFVAWIRRGKAAPRMREGRDAGVRLTLALPTKNEAGGIAGLIREAKAYADEILVVDGHSTDGTPADR